jgi:hypothetical protein
MDINPIVLLVGYFVSCLAGSLIVNISKSPLISFLGYNLIVVPIGALLSICLPAYPTEHIFMAMLLTGVVTLVMMALAAAKPNFFAKLGPTLFFSLLIGVIVEFVASLLGYHGDIFNWFFVIRDPFYLLPEKIAPWIMPLINIASFFGVEQLLCLPVKLARKGLKHNKNMNNRKGENL